MTAYYNEFDPNAAAWLRELIKRGLIADGEVDETDIRDIRPADLHGFTQCHFFAGIGVWSYALRQAGWPDDRPVWTGSCPCQPFSAAGTGNGFTDERHLWPHFFHLSKYGKRRDVPIFGEQVASKDGLSWIDLVQSDMEGEGYAFAAADLCAAGVGAPHIRQRLFWVGHTSSVGQQGSGEIRRSSNSTPGENREISRIVDDGGRSGMANTSSIGRGKTGERYAEAERAGAIARNSGILEGQSTTSPTNGFWRDVDWLFGRDGKWRPVEPGTFALVDGSANRMGYGSDPITPELAASTGEARKTRLKGYGNAIVAPLAQIFIEAYLEITE